MSQNGQTHFKNPAAFAAKFLKCVWPFWDIMHWRVKTLLQNNAKRFKLLEEIFFSEVLELF